MNAMVVKSKVRYVQSLSQKKVRDADRVFIAEGPKIINELLNEARFQPVELFALHEWISENGNIGKNVTEVDEVLLSRLTHLSTPNQVIGIFRMQDLGVFQPQNSISLLLDNIQDPGNLGTIVRCADWFGVRQIVCSADCADVYNPKTVQSTMGSIARVEVFYRDLQTVITENKIKVYAASLSGKHLGEVGPINEGMIIIGNESRGIRESLMQLAEEKITIPRKGRAESLNAAVAAGIILASLTR